MSCYDTRINEIIFHVYRLKCGRVCVVIRDKFWQLFDLAIFRNSSIRQILSVANKSQYMVYITLLDIHSF